jgi:6-pyruvoyltetrahydropterin/6-carboxytetrahydropterin synthase
MEVQLEGEVDDFGMVVDFGDLKALVKPIVGAMDHAFFRTPYTPKILVEALTVMDSKMYDLPSYSTAEVLVQHLLEVIGERILENDAFVRVHQLSIKVWENAASWAQDSVEFVDGDEGSVGSSLGVLLDALGEVPGDLETMLGLGSPVEGEEDILEEEKLDVVYPDKEQA